MDVYHAWPTLETGKLAAAAQKAKGEGLELTMIDNRGVEVGRTGYRKRCRPMRTAAALHPAPPATRPHKDSKPDARE